VLSAAAAIAEVRRRMGGPLWPPRPGTFGGGYSLALGARVPWCRLPAEVREPFRARRAFPRPGGLGVHLHVLLCGDGLGEGAAATRRAAMAPCSCSCCCQGPSPRWCGVLMGASPFGGA